MAALSNRILSFMKITPRQITLPVRQCSNTSDLIDLKVNDKTGVAIVAMNKPPVNSLSLEMIQALSKTLDDLSENRCRGMILTSTSPTVFSAGLDIMEMYKPNEERVKAFWTELQDLWIKLYGSYYPTVAAITGHSPAGGCLLSLSCEYRVMMPNFTIGLNETQLGIAAPPWFAVSMINVIGMRKTEMSLTTGKMYKTDEALAIGLIDEIGNTREEVIAKSERFLARFQKIPSAARAITKQMLRMKSIDELESNRDNDLNIFLSFINDERVQKGLEMYMEALKRQQQK